jgi:hypothetical protein
MIHCSKRLHDLEHTLTKETLAALQTIIWKPSLNKRVLHISAGKYTSTN